MTDLPDELAKRIDKFATNPHDNYWARQGALAGDAFGYKRARQHDLNDPICACRACFDTRAKIYRADLANLATQAQRVRELEASHAALVEALSATVPVIGNAVQAAPAEGWQRDTRLMILHQVEKALATARKLMEAHDAE